MRLSKRDFQHVFGDLDINPDDAITPAYESEVPLMFEDKLQSWFKFTVKTIWLTFLIAWIINTIRKVLNQ